MDAGWSIEKTGNLLWESDAVSMYKSIAIIKTVFGGIPSDNTVRL